MLVRGYLVLGAVKFAIFIHCYGSNLIFAFGKLLGVWHFPAKTILHASRVDYDQLPSRKLSRQNNIASQSHTMVTLSAL